MQFFNNFKITHQRAQLGGGSQIQLGALIDIERLVEIIRLNSRLNAIGRQFVEIETVNNPPRIGRTQQTFAI